MIIWRSFQAFVKKQSDTLLPDGAHFTKKANNVARKVRITNIKSYKLGTHIHLGMKLLII